MIEKELAVMKKIVKIIHFYLLNKDHPNVVTLFELIDDVNSDKIYLVLEYIKKGALLSRSYKKLES